MLIAALQKIHKRWNCVLSNQRFVVHGQRGQFCKFAMSRQATFSISGSLTESKLCLGTAASAECKPDHWIRCGEKLWLPTDFP